MLNLCDLLDEGQPVSCHLCKLCLSVNLSLSVSHLYLLDYIHGNTFLHMKQMNSNQMKRPVTKTGTRPLM